MGQHHALVGRPAASLLVPSQWDKELLAALHFLALLSNYPSAATESASQSSATAHYTTTHTHTISCVIARCRLSALRSRKCEKLALEASRRPRVN